MVFNSTELREMPKQQDGNCYPPYGNARYDYDASRIRLCRIVNVNGIIENKSMVSQDLSNVINSGGLEWQYIVNSHLL